MKDDMLTSPQCDENIPEEDITKTSTPNYFEKPTQVLFMDFDSEVNHKDNSFRKVLGIAYQDYIICGECGGVIELSDYFAEAEENGVDMDDALVIYEFWYEVWF